MSYPIYKLLRAVNRQYPNNGFINYVDVREDMYNHELIDEDLRDLINETIQEVYKDVAIDEVWSFPTVPGQNQYVLPEDCDLRDIQEVTRTFVGVRGPLRPPFGPGPGPVPPGPEPHPEFDKIVTFEIDTEKGSMTSTQGTSFGSDTIFYSVHTGSKVPEVPTVTANEGYTFIGWTDTQWTIAPEIVPIEEILNREVTEDITYRAVFEEGDDDMRNIFTASLSEDIEHSDQYNLVPIALDVENKVGTGFTLDNSGRIVIGSGITKVLVSGQVCAEYQVDDSTKIIRISKLSGGVSTVIEKEEFFLKEDEKRIGDEFVTAFSPTLVDVQEGDKIFLSFVGAEGDVVKGTNSFTHLTVEEVKVSGNPLGGNGSQGGTSISGGYVPINPLG